MYFFGNADSVRFDSMESSFRYLVVSEFTVIRAPVSRKKGLENLLNHADVLWRRSAELFGLDEAIPLNGGR